MNKIPNRDITGRCDEGECRNLVREGEEKRQKEISTEKYSGSTTPSMKHHAHTRNENPGFLGGHV